MAIENAAPRSNVIPFPGVFHRQSRSTWRGANTLQDIRLAADEDDDQVFMWAAGMAWLEAYYDPNSHDEGSYPNGDHPRALVASDEGELELFDCLDPATPDPRPGFEVVCLFSPNTCQARIASCLRDHMTLSRLRDHLSACCG